MLNFFVCKVLGFCGVGVIVVGFVNDCVFKDDNKNDFLYILCIVIIVDKLY